MNGALPTWLIQDARGDFVLTLHIQPGAKTTAVQGKHGDALKVRLAAPPVDGKANQALLAFLADQLGLAKRDIELVSGQSSREKRVRISNCSADALRALMPR